MTIIWNRSSPGKMSIGTTEAMMVTILDNTIL